MSGDPNTVPNIMVTLEKRQLFYSIDIYTNACDRISRPYLRAAGVASEWSHRRASSVCRTWGWGGPSAWPRAPWAACSTASRPSRSPARAPCTAGSAPRSPPGCWCVGAVPTIKSRMTEKRYQTETKEVLIPHNKDSHKFGKKRLLSTYSNEFCTFLYSGFKPQTFQAWSLKACAPKKVSQANAVIKLACMVELINFIYTHRAQRKKSGKKSAR